MTPGRAFLCASLATVSAGLYWRLWYRTALEVSHPERVDVEAAAGGLRELWRLPPDDQLEAIGLALKDYRP